MNLVEAQECLQRVNLYRQVHQAQDLELDEDLCKQAAKWAAQLASKDRLEHSPREDRENQGENLSGHTGEQEIVKAVDRWYGEEKDYSFKKNKFSGNTGHFTQIVWQATKKFGIAQAKSSTGWTYVVARFSPPGNLIVTPPGEEECFKQNVKKADKSLEKAMKTLKIVKESSEPKKFKAPGKDEQKEVLDQINRIRGNHKVNSLTLDKKLVEEAEKWAKKIAKNDKPESGNAEDQGECLFTYSGPNFKLSGAVDAWHGGKEKYNFNKPGWQPGSGNFTQLVWADTENFGVAAAQSKSGKIYVCARFSPPGNVIVTPPGEAACFEKNVFAS